MTYELQTNEAERMSLRTQLLEALDRLQSPVTRGDIAKATGATQQDIDEIITALNAEGKVVIRKR